MGRDEGGRPAETVESLTEAPEADGKGGIAKASFNFINSIIGAGIISLPFAMRDAGFVAGVILLLIVAASTFYSVRLLVRMGYMSKTLNYEVLAGRVLGPGGFYAVVVAQFLFAYGAMVAYLIITGDTLAVVSAHWMGATSLDPLVRTVAILVIALVVVLPLSCIRNMASLSWSSMLSLVAVLWIIVFTVVRAVTGAEVNGGESGSPSGSAPTPDPHPTHDPDYHGSWVTVIDTQRIWGAVSIIAFAFVCHHNSFLVFQSIRNATDARWGITVRTSIGISSTCSILLATAGFVTFGTSVKANLLNSYASGDELANATRTMFALTMILTYPLEMYVVRHCIFIVLFGEPGHGKGDHEQGLEEDTLAQDAASLPFWKHGVITLVVWASTVAIAASVRDLGIVIELTGGVSAVCVGFIIPALLHFRLAVPAVAPWCPRCCSGDARPLRPWRDGVAIEEVGSEAEQAVVGMAQEGSHSRAGDGQPLAGGRAAGKAVPPTEIELAPLGAANGAAAKDADARLDGGDDDNGDDDAEKGELDGGDATATPSATSTSDTSASAAMATPPKGSMPLWIELLPSAWLLVFGVVALVTSTVTAISNAANGGSGGGEAEV